MFDSDQLSVIKWCWWSLPVWTLIRTSVMFRSVRSPRWSSTLWSTWFWLPRLYFCGNQWNSKKGWTHGGQRQQGGSMLCRDELGLQHKPEQRHYQLEQPLKLTTIQPIRLQDVQRNVCVCELTPATLLLRRSPPWHAGRWTNRTTVRMTWAARSTHSTRSHRTRPGSHTHTHTPAVNQSVHRLQLRPCVSVVSDLPASVSVSDVSSQHSTNHEAQKNHLRTQREVLQHFHIAITLMSSHASDVMKQEAALLTVNVIDQWDLFRAADHIKSSHAKESPTEVRVTLWEFRGFSLTGWRKLID